VNALSLKELASVHAVGPTRATDTVADKLDKIEDPFAASPAGHQTSQVAAS
jgi:hypothetical protein